MKKLTVWRQVAIPAHDGPEDLLGKIDEAGMHTESWARQVMLARPFPIRHEPLTFNVCSASSVDLGYRPEQLVAIAKSKMSGQAKGLKLLDNEKLMALRLAYKDQPREWMRAAVMTYVDEDGAWLDMALVNDGARIDLRTTWAFPTNSFQVEHQWLWELP